MRDLVLGVGTSLHGGSGFWGTKTVLAGALAVSMLVGCTGGAAGPEAPSAVPQVTSASGPTAAARFQYADVDLHAVAADETFATATVDDWVRQADHVVVLRVVAEAQLSPSRSEIRRHEGLIGREVHAEVESIVWTRPNGSRRVSKRLRYQDFGWIFEGTVDNKKRIGVPGRPYVLPGHTYLIALRWFDWNCPGMADPQDGTMPARFAPLGARAIVPFDDVLGAGEYEGYRTDDVRLDDPMATFRGSMVNQSLPWVASALAEAAARLDSFATRVGPGSCRKKAG